MNEGRLIVCDVWLVGKVQQKRLGRVDKQTERDGIRITHAREVYMPFSYTQKSV